MSDDWTVVAVFGKFCGEFRSGKQTEAYMRMKSLKLIALPSIASNLSELAYPLITLGASTSIHPLYP